MHLFKVYRNTYIVKTVCLFHTETKNIIIVDLHFKFIVFYKMQI